MTSAIVTASLVQAVVNMAAYLTCIGQHRCVAAPVELAKCVAWNFARAVELRQSYLRLAKRISKSDSRRSTAGRRRELVPERLCRGIVPNGQRE